MLLGPGGGEVLRETPERTTRVLADRPELVAVLFRYGPGERGPDLHVHHHHADCFYVLDGELTFELDGGPVTGGPGTFILVPPHVVHTFRNDGPAEATFLNLHAPGMGFAAYLRGDEGFDQHEPPAGGSAPGASPHRLGPGDGEPLVLGNASSSILASAGTGIGSLALMETVLEPGFPGPPPHRHRRMVDSFYVLEGTLSLTHGDETLEAPAGSWATLEPGTRHTFCNASAERVRLLNVMAPAGLEGYGRAAAQLAAEQGRPPEPSQTAAIAPQYDFEPA